MSTMNPDNVFSTYNQEATIVALAQDIYYRTKENIRKFMHYLIINSIVYIILTILTCIVQLSIGTSVVGFLVPILISIICIGLSILPWIYIVQSQVYIKYLNISSMDTNKIITLSDADLVDTISDLYAVSHIMKSHLKFSKLYMAIYTIIMIIIVIGGR